MPMNETRSAPTVFISYSHDSKDHKIWVLELARRLKSANLEVVLDATDLDYGDDVAKFMEHWVSNSDWVLMVCSPNYVAKANEGVGGAGYEAMIVTQDLISNVGVKKFIPVISSSLTSERIQLPKCVATRYAVTLSDTEEGEKAFKKLVKQLQKSPPPKKEAASNPIRRPAVAPPSTLSEKPEDAYEQAFTIAEAGNFPRWRKLITAKKHEAFENLWEWKNKKENLPGNPADMSAHVGEGLAGFQSFFACVCAAIESEQSKFTKQIAVVHDLLEPPGWSQLGTVNIVAMSGASAWFFVALTGAAYVHTMQAELAIELATQRILDWKTEKERPIYLSRIINTCPYFFRNAQKEAFGFLWNTPDQFTWITRPFGSKRDYQISLCAFHLLLSWMDFVDTLKVDVDFSKVWPESPTCFLFYEENRHGKRKLLENRALLAEYAKSRTSSQRCLKMWPSWIEVMEKDANSLRAFWNAPSRESLLSFAEEVFA